MKADGAAFIIFLRVILLIYKKIIINEPECNAFFLKQYSQISDNIMVMIDEFKHFTVNQKRDRFIKLYAPIQNRLEKNILFHI